MSLRIEHSADAEDCIEVDASTRRPQYPAAFDRQVDLTQTSTFGDGQAHSFRRILDFDVGANNMTRRADEENEDHLLPIGRIHHDERFQE
ncbi:MAG: hypothetical protein OXU19_17710 [bacterium]|nr:hypothetical protein [bacterium]MDE0415588.1 hypothetical protein [bacterium]